MLNATFEAIMLNMCTNNCIWKIVKLLHMYRIKIDYITKLNQLNLCICMHYAQYSAGSYYTSVLKILSAQIANINNAYLYTSRMIGAETIIRLLAKWDRQFT